MKVDFTPLYVAFGLGLATYTLLRLRKSSPPVKFKDVLYDKHKSEVRLIVENTSAKPVYLKPELRVMRLIPAGEFRGSDSGSDGVVPMMSASAGSVIKGYDLVGEYPEPVMVPANCTKSLVYPVSAEVGFKTYDRIKVDASFGSEPNRLSGTVSATVKMKLRELLDEKGAVELLDLLEEQLGAVGVDYNKEGSFKQVMEIKSKEALDVAPIGARPAKVEPPQAPIYRRSEFPLESMCFCCGKQKWLNWVVSGSYVCDECRDYLAPSPAAQRLEVSDSAKQELGDVEDEPDDLPNVELVYREPAELKPRHEKILQVINGENTITVNDISKRLNRKKKHISADLRYLMECGLVDRVKIGRVYKYFSLKDSEQVVLQNEQPSDDTMVWT